MKYLNFKKIAPYLAIFAVFVALAYAYTPDLLSGKIVNQSDISSWRGMANEIITYNESHPGERALWTNSMFGGMPATQISVIYNGDYTKYLYDLLFAGERPASYLLISLIGGFLLSLAFGVNRWLALLGAIAITFCSYNMQIIQVGHNSKMVAIAFMPWVLAAVVYAYRKRPLLGSALCGLALSFQIKANHPQISYYLAIVIIGFAIWQLCSAIKERRFASFAKTSAMLLVCGLIGIATNLNHLLPTYEYAKHTMRGGTELSAEGAANGGNEAGVKSRSGLDLEYATAWSYGIDETPNLFIPNFNGGSSSGSLERESNTGRFLRENGYDADSILKSVPLYWGPQPFTAGPMYMGAISVFLALLGLMILKGGMRWWVSGVSLLALLLGWGSHVMPVSEFFFNWVPLYNKFRTVSMILVVLQLLIPLTAVMVLNKILFTSTPQERAPMLKKLYIAAGASGLFCLAFTAIPSLAGSFVAAGDAQMPKAFVSALVPDRMSLLSADAWRSFIFVALAAAVLYAAMIQKLKPLHAVAALALLVTIDLWTIDKRYLNSSHFVSKSQFDKVFAERPVDKMIHMDKDPDYRVLDLSVSTFNDAYTSYHHKTIGGYSPAKIQRYQDLIERCISKEINHIMGSLQTATSLEQAQDAIGYEKVISMLNARYIILNGEYPPLVNKYALGNAWFAEELATASNADEEMALLQEIDPARCAVLSKEFAERVPQMTPADSADAASSSISLISYSPNRLEYSYKGSSNKLAIFSEVYYAPGWRAYLTPALEGEEVEVPVLRANYILRALALPQGEYKIRFEFEPEVFAKGERYSIIASALLLLLLLLQLPYVFNKADILRRKVSA